MPAKISLVLDLPPLGNRYWRMARNQIYQTKDAREYKRAVAALGLANCITPFVGEVAVSICVYRARKAGDLDGYAKVLLDALENVCYENDRQIVELRAMRFDDKSNPRVEVEVWQVRPI